MPKIYANELNWQAECLTGWQTGWRSAWQEARIPRIRRKPGHHADCTLPAKI